MAPEHKRLQRYPTMTFCWRFQLLNHYVHVLPVFSERILHIDAAVVERCAKLHVPNPRAERNALIAATALVHGMTIVTRNVNDFAKIEVEILNPWEP